MKVGIFGGTFDPIHIAHLRACEEVREIFGLERIYFVPALIPPHKREQIITDAKDRLTMLKIALRGKKGFFVSDIEIRRGGISYTIETVKHFKKRFKELYFILGEEGFREIETWFNYGDMFFFTNFIVTVRKKSNRNEQDYQIPLSLARSFNKKENGVYLHVSGKMIFFTPVTDIDISSTRIRNLVREGRSIKYLVPEAVEKYIIHRGLYRI